MHTVQDDVCLYILQQDVLGLSLHEITHEDDAKVIDENLQPNGEQAPLHPSPFTQTKGTSPS